MTIDPATIEAVARAIIVELLEKPYHQGDVEWFLAQPRYLEIDMVDFRKVALAAITALRQQEAENG